MDETDQVSSTTPEEVSKNPSLPVTEVSTESSKVQPAESQSQGSPGTNLNGKKRKTTDEECEVEDKEEVVTVSGSPSVTSMELDVEGNRPVVVTGAEEPADARNATKEMGSSEVPEPEPEPEVELRVIFNKQQIPVRISLSKTVGKKNEKCHTHIK
jgi:hypothetical protein